MRWKWWCNLKEKKQLCFYFIVYASKWNALTIHMEQFGTLIRASVILCVCFIRIGSVVIFLFQIRFLFKTVISYIREIVQHTLCCIVIHFHLQVWLIIFPGAFWGMKKTIYFCELIVCPHVDKAFAASSV